MEPFELPHRHEDASHLHELEEYLRRTEYFQTVALVFRQLSDANRVRLFWLLCHCEECVVNLAAMMGMSPPALSHHLRQLRESGLIVSRRDGKEVYYRAADTEESRLLHEIVERVMEIACPEKAVDFQASQEEIIRRVHTYLTEHLSERITIEALSREFLMNTTTLKSAFKRVYGSSIAQHMKQHRMEAAAARLTQTQDDIAAIAKAVGYESQSRFTEAFREVYGEVPTEYRKRRCRTAENGAACCSCGKCGK